MAHVLIINPNTRQALSAQLVAQIGAGLEGTGLQVMGATAPFGSDYIASEQSYVVAAHAVLDAWAAHVLEHGRPRAVLVACFGDPGVWALRETTGVPVMGLAEAALREALALGPTAIVTGGAAWGPMLTRLARGLQMWGPARLRRVCALEATGGGLAAHPEAGLAMLSQACAEVLAEDLAATTAATTESPHGRLVGAPPLRSLIVGGAALGGWAERLSPPSPQVQLIDSVAAGGRWLRAAA